MKEIGTISNTVKGAIDQLYDKAMKEQESVFMEINDLIIIVAPIKHVRWKRDLDKIVDEKGIDIIKVIN